MTIQTIEQRLEQAAQEADEKIRTCHERRACPRCGQPLGKPCIRVGAVRTYAKPLKHPHADRWTQDVPLR